MEDNHSGKESNYNEASFQMQRIDKSRQIISELMTNFLYYNIFERKHNYEMVVTELLNLSQEIKGKLSENEKETANKMRDILITLLELSPPHMLLATNSFGGTEQIKFINKRNWHRIRNIIFIFYDFIVEMLELHEFSAPNKDTEEIWD